MPDPSHEKESAGCKLPLIQGAKQNYIP